MAGENKIALGVINQKVVYTPFIDAISKPKSLDQELIEMSQILAI